MAAKIRGRRIRATVVPATPREVGYARAVHPLDHVIAALLLLWPPLWGATFGYHRLATAPRERLGTVRPSVYRTAIILQWSMVTLVLVHWLGTGRGLRELGLMPLLTPGLGGIAIGLAIASVFLVRARNRALEDDDALHAMLGRLRSVEPLIPTTPQEMRLFTALSVTAGVCEEILYRGFLISYLSHSMGLIPAVLVSGAMFGVAHLYQGPRGILTTGFAGLFLGGVYALSGSLYAPMVMHALMDLHSGHIGYVALKRRAQERASTFVPEGGRSMNRVYDVAVAGLGAMGSAALYHLAERGSRVIGFERFESPHARGSSHGGSRIIREAYFEHPAYVPLVQRAYELWAALEREHAERLLLETGGLMIGPADGVLVSGALRSAREHGLRHEVLAASEVERRFPAFRLDPSWVGLWEPRAGVLRPERCVAAHLAGAAERGADVHMNEPVESWSVSDGVVTVDTATGRYEARRLVLAGGPWMPQLLGDLELPLEVERVVQAWFPTASPDHDPARCPITIWEHEPGRFFYSFPALEGRVKAAIHGEGERTTADALRTLVAREELTELERLLARHEPAAAGPHEAAAACMYTRTPDQHFVLDLHPAHPEVVIVSPCSGHGFKFASAIGEVVAQLAHDERPGQDLSLFGATRFAAAKVAP